jgi:hypothetical protein
MLPIPAGRAPPLSLPFTSLRSRPGASFSPFADGIFATNHRQGSGGTAEQRSCGNELERGRSPLPLAVAVATMSVGDVGLLGGLGPGMQLLQSASQYRRALQSAMPACTRDATATASATADRDAAAIPVLRRYCAMALESTLQK